MTDSAIDNDAPDPATDAMALALASGRTIQEAADAGSVSPRTVYRRLTEAPFQKRVAELRAQMISRAVGRLAEFAIDAVEVMHQLMKGAESEQVRLGAARSLLECGTRLREASELESRLLALEAAQGAAK